MKFQHAKHVKPLSFCEAITTQPHFQMKSCNSKMQKPHGSPRAECKHAACISHRFSASCTTQYPAQTAKTLQSPLSTLHSPPSAPSCTHHSRLYPIFLLPLHSTFHAPFSTLHGGTFHSTLHSKSKLTCHSPLPTFRPSNFPSALHSPVSTPLSPRHVPLQSSTPFPSPLFILHPPVRLSPPSHVSSPNLESRGDVGRVASVSVARSRLCAPATPPGACFFRIAAGSAANYLATPSCHHAESNCGHACRQP